MSGQWVVGKEDANVGTGGAWVMGTPGRYILPGDCARRAEAKAIPCFGHSLGGTRASSSHKWRFRYATCVLVIIVSCAVYCIGLKATLELLLGRSSHITQRAPREIDAPRATPRTDGGKHEGGQIFALGLGVVHLLCRIRQPTIDQEP